MNNINKTLKKSLLILLPFCLIGGAGVMAAIDFSFGVGHGGYRRGHGYYNKGYRYYGPHYRHYRPYRPAYQRSIIYVGPSQQYNYAMPSAIISMNSRQYNIMESLWSLDFRDRFMERDMDKDREILKKERIERDRKIDIRNKMKGLRDRFIREYKEYESLLRSRNYDRVERYRYEKEKRLYEMNDEFMRLFAEFSNNTQPISSEKKQQGRY